MHDPKEIPVSGGRLGRCKVSTQLSHYIVPDLPLKVCAYLGDQLLAQLFERINNLRLFFLLVRLAREVDRLQPGHFLLSIRLTFI